LRQISQLPVCAQKAIAQPVKRAHPHAAHVHGQHGRQTREHFFGRLVGKRHRQNATRRHLPRLHKPRNARRQHPRLARARARQDEGMRLRQGHRRRLFVVEALEQGGCVGGRMHAGIVERLGMRNQGKRLKPSRVNSVLLRWQRFGALCQLFVFGIDSTL